MKTKNMYIATACLLLLNSFAYGFEIPFGQSGIMVTVPTWEYSCIEVSHYKKADSLDLIIFTSTLSRRGDKGEGILLRFSPTIETYKPFIQEKQEILTRIKQGDNAYSQFSPDKKKEPFNLLPLLPGKDKQQIYTFCITKDKWHNITKYYRTDKGIFVISVWDVNGNPQDNLQLVKAMKLIQKKCSTTEAKKNLKPTE